LRSQSADVLVFDVHRSNRLKELRVHLRSSAVSHVEGVLM